MAADENLVAVLESVPLDPLAVDEYAVQAAVVEDAHPVGLAHHERVTARHRRVVEAQVGGERAPDARRLARQGDDHDTVAAVVCEVLARLGEEVGTRLAQPVGAVVLGLVRLLAGEPGRGEERRADELLPAAAGAFRQGVLGCEGNDVVAVPALERADARQRARMKWLHLFLSSTMGLHRQRAGSLPGRSISDRLEVALLRPLAGFVRGATNPLRHASVRPSRLTRTRAAAGRAASSGRGRVPLRRLPAHPASG